MTPIDTVNILGKRYEVRYSDKQVSGDCAGATDVIFKVIHIWRNPQHPEDTMDTLLHEICEAIIAELGLVACVQQGMVADTFVRPFATALADTLLRNGLIDNVFAEPKVFRDGE